MGTSHTSPAKPNSSGLDLEKTSRLRSRQSFFLDIPFDRTHSVAIRLDSGSLGLSNKCSTGCHRLHFFLSAKIAVAVVNPPQPPLATLPLPLCFIKFQYQLAVFDLS